MNGLKNSVVTNKFFGTLKINVHHQNNISFFMDDMKNIFQIIMQKFNRYYNIKKSNSLLI